jgi:hypothetical protein
MPLKCETATVRRHQHDLGAPNQLARGVAVADQGLKLSAVGGVKVKADVGASHATNMPHLNADWNLVSGGEH